MPRLLILLLAAGLLCAACDDGDEPLSTHAALHEIADEACGELEGVDAAEAATIVDEAIDEAADLGEPEAEIREILGEECADLLVRFGLDS